MGNVVKLQKDDPPVTRAYLRKLPISGALWWSIVEGTCRLRDGMVAVVSRLEHSNSDGTWRRNCTECSKRRKLGYVAKWYWHTQFESIHIVCETCALEILNYSEPSGLPSDDPDNYYLDTHTRRSN